ncbi:hypothetical protein BRYFOR_07093 [Marvinbryantia formatexigens DSM 14469]|uniref:Uncharacterized protein n=1 Tax=Marvinbryantia formatexigens DSM 14469 TaxID=478749 RepID=C6LEP2_9FIRM|nr:hypothetical protein BRYFOR_07093 [Marvinbryantia formatexigens DSM 14469]
MHTEYQLQTKAAFAGGLLSAWLTQDIIQIQKGDSHGKNCKLYD